MSFNLIVPVAADRPEFEDRVPYWMDMHPHGNLFLYEAISGLNLKSFNFIYITLLKKHELKYQISDALMLQFEKVRLIEKLKIVLIESPTQNQPETVAITIEQEKIKGAIVIKDADNHFECNLQPGNFICTYPLDDLTSVNPGNKSYIAIDESSFITNIIEKKIISRWFCVGAYSFEDSALFLNYFKKLAANNKLYISHLIYAMLLDKINFRPANITNYLDWGREKEWKNFKNQFHTILLPLEFVLSNIDIVPYLNKLYHSEKVNIAILAGKNNLNNLKQIENQLKHSLNLKYHYIFSVPYNGKFSLVKSRKEVINLAEQE